MSTENHRAARAEKVLKAYRKSNRAEYGPKEELRIVMRDLMTDLAHFCWVEGIDVGERWEAAMEVYEEEFEDEAECDGTSGQDRESYSDDQDRDNYT